MPLLMIIPNPFPREIYSYIIEKATVNDTLSKPRSFFNASIIVILMAAYVPRFPIKLRITPELIGSSDLWI